MIARKQKTSKEKLVAAERRNEAYAMRRNGASLQDIATMLTVTVGRACQLVQEAMNEVREGRLAERTHWFDHDFSITTEMLEESLPKALAGDREAFKDTISLLARRANMWGLDAPKKLDVNIEEPLPTYNQDEMIRMMIENVRSEGRLIEATATPKPANGDVPNGNSEK